jgi:hypothetical protein
VRVIEFKSKEFRKRLAWAEERDWKGAVKKFDRKFWAVVYIALTDHCAH